PIFCNLIDGEVLIKQTPPFEQHVPCLNIQHKNPWTFLFFRLLRSIGKLFSQVVTHRRLCNTKLLSDFAPTFTRSKCQLFSFLFPIIQNPSPLSAYQNPKTD